MNGNKITSLILSEFVNNIIILSIPNPSPPVGGIPVSIALTNNNEIYVWGENMYGQLGLGDDKNGNSPQKLKLEF